MNKLFVTLAAVALPAAAHAQIVNGGFEAPLVGGICCTTTPPDPLPGWTVTAGDVNVVTGTFSSSAGQNLAYQGAQYLDLVGQSGAGAISQSFATVLGQTYTLTFAYSHNLFSGLGSASANFSVGSLSGSLTHATGSNANLDWQVYTGNFVALGATSTLSFVNTAGASSAGVLLDAVAVNGAVPEPASWAMMIAGFGLVGGAMRRRRTATLTYA